MSDNPIRPLEVDANNGTDAATKTPGALPAIAHESLNNRLIKREVLTQTNKARHAEHNR